MTKNKLYKDIMEITSEQKQIKKSVREFMVKEISPVAEEIDRNDAFPDGLSRSPERLQSGLRTITTTTSNTRVLLPISAPSLDRFLTGLQIICIFLSEPARRCPRP